jgi:hypothetical protein
VIHYHGLPITPATAAVATIEHGHAFVSFAHSDQLGVAVASASSFAIDNGAFSSWRSGKPITDWSEFYFWAEQCKRIPSCDFAVIPDVIDGDEAANDALLEEWDDQGLPCWYGAPVWHMHESMDRLERLAKEWPRICIGSSGAWSVVGNDAWHHRMAQAMRVVCNDDGQPICKLHGLRMLNPKVFTMYPFASADSTNIGRNVGIDSGWKGTYLPPTKEARATLMRSRIESHNAPARYQFSALQQDIFA